MPRETVGDLAIVLHSHMPYVEGFGTFPFGEEWLFDAVIRSYLPVLEEARGLTMSVTPVLADQLEDEAVIGRLREFLVSYRIGGAEADARDVDSEHRPAALAEEARYRRALELLDRHCNGPLGAFAEAEREGRIALLASSATHAVLPLLATGPGLHLQIDAGLRSHRRRFGWDGGFWLPECAYSPAIEWDLAEHGVRHFCVDQSAHGRPLDALAPVSTEAGPTAFTLDWEAVSWLWSMDGYPSDPAYAEFHGKSWRGTRIFSIGGGAYMPDAAHEKALVHAREFVEAIRERLAGYEAERGRRGLVVFAIDTELLGHWWSEGPLWLAEVIRRAAGVGVRLVTLPEALAEHEPERRPLRGSTWGEGKDFRTWDSTPVADLLWGARRLELRLLRSLRNGVNGAAAQRAARELLAIQSSDWAFLDHRRQAGDYAYTRAVNHSQAMLEALDSRTPPDPRMRSLAPDLSLAPLLIP